MEEVKYYFLIVLASIGVIFFNILHLFQNAADALCHAAFQVASIITTTGFSTVDFNIWPETSRTILILLMFIGACAGSTGGGIKVSRIIILVKSSLREINSYLHPKSIKKITMESKPLDNELIHTTNIYFATFMSLFTVSVMALSFNGKDFITNFTAVAATINNIGPGLELVGPTQNFGIFSLFSKWVLIFDMLAGRLELYPLLILFHPAIWKDSLKKCKK